MMFLPFTWVVVEVWTEYQQMLPTGIDTYEDTWHYSFLSEEGLVFSHGGSVYSFPPFSPQHVLNVFTARHRTNSKNDMFSAPPGWTEEYKHFKSKRNEVIFICTKLGHHKKDSDLYVEKTS